jgi:DNA-binding XRE family transcriptional regulator
MSDTAFPTKSRAEQIAEARFGRPLPDLLREMYHDRGLTQAEMARELGIARPTVVDWMKRHGVETGYNRATEVA